MKQARKSCFCLISIMLVIGLSGCIFTPANPDCALPENFCVGLVTDVGKIDDQALNQMAWEGVQRAEKNLAAHITYIETVDTRDYGKNIATFADAGYDVIVTVGYGQGKATFDAAWKYRRTKFIAVDQPLGPEKTIPENLSGLTFPEDQAGFLAGALAALMTKTNKIGAVCGPDSFPPAWRYCEGFKAGAKYANSAVVASTLYHNEIAFNDSLADPKWDAAAANTLIDGGADIIFGADSYGENGAASAAAARSVYAIGVNTDQYLILRDARNSMLSSAMKKVAVGVFELIKAARNKTFQGGNITGKVEFAPFHDLANQVSADVRTRMAEIENDLADGTLETGVLSQKP